ncbi:MAG TPA: ABC transporter permease, partial [Candidatus Eisenbacteria bacterium]|nr:ABC transporter permease [Candidatus Eisenbacteria bacterium]
TGPADSARVALLSADGPDLETWWLPLARIQRDAGLAGAASLLQARVADADQAARVTRALAGTALEAHVVHALSATEAALLARMRRLMLLVTLAALLAAGLCAFGTLTDLALERRREIALMKALGADERDIARQLVLESLAIGVTGGIAGWLVGFGFAELIGREVFSSTIALRPDVPAIVLALAVAVAALAGLGPLRLARGVEPAAVLKGE